MHTPATGYSLTISAALSLGADGHATLRPPADVVAVLARVVDRCWAMRDARVRIERAVNLDDGIHCRAQVNAICVRLPAGGHCDIPLPDPQVAELESGLACPPETGPGVVLE